MTSVSDPQTELLGASGEGSSPHRLLVSTVGDELKIADGRVWTGQQALPIKLIDQIADFRGAVKDTAKAVGISGEPNLVRPSKPKRTLADLIFGDVSDFLPDKAKLLETHVGFYYLWK